MSQQLVCAQRPARPAAAALRGAGSAFLGGGLRSAPLAAARRPARRPKLAVAGLFGLGVPELAVIAGVAALIFGACAAPGERGWAPPLAGARRSSVCRCLPRCNTPKRPGPCAPAGPSKLPELGKGLGKTVKNFQSAAKVRGVWPAVAGARRSLPAARRAVCALLPPAHLPRMRPAAPPACPQEFEKELKEAAAPDEDAPKPAAAAAEKKDEPPAAPPKA